MPIQNLHQYDLETWRDGSNQARYSTGIWPSGLTSGLIGLISLLIVYIAPTSAQTGTSAQVCPIFLMDFECAQRNQRLEHATSQDERGRIEREYRELIKQRRKLCRAGNDHDRR